MGPVQPSPTTPTPVTPQPTSINEPPTIPPSPTTPQNPAQVPSNPPGSPGSPSATPAAGSPGTGGTATSVESVNPALTDSGLITSTASDGTVVTLSAINSVGGTEVVVFITVSGTAVPVKTIIPGRSNPTSNSAPSQPNSNDNGGGGIPIGLIGGIAGGVVVLLGAIFLLIFVARRRRQRQQQQPDKKGEKSDASWVGAAPTQYREQSRDYVEPPQELIVPPPRHTSIMPQASLTQLRPGTAEPPLPLQWQAPPSAATEVSLFGGVDSKKDRFENEMPLVRLTVVGPSPHPSKEAQAYQSQDSIPQGPAQHQQGPSESSTRNSILKPVSLFQSETIYQPVLPSVDSIEGWTTDQVAAALAEAGVAPNYVAILNKYMVNGYLLLRLTDEELERMGVRSQTARNTILYAVDQISGRGEVVRSVEAVPRGDLPQYAAI
ncbi:hypothetical protein HDU97_010036 [Phlyctochytrium planicorne]|nr:hypothetical protein HDU97_010036 [Phlyctochytrium planicorne]